MSPRYAASSSSRARGRRCAPAGLACRGARPPRQAARRRRAVPRRASCEGTSRRPRASSGRVALARARTKRVCGAARGGDSFAAARCRIRASPQAWIAWRSRGTSRGCRRPQAGRPSRRGGAVELARDCRGVNRRRRRERYRWTSRASPEDEAARSAGRSRAASHRAAAAAAATAGPSSESAARPTEPRRGRRRNARGLRRSLGRPRMPCLGEPRRGGRGQLVSHVVGPGRSGRVAHEPGQSRRSAGGIASQ